MVGGAPISSQPEWGLDKWPSGHPAPESAPANPTYISLQVGLSPAQLNLSLPCLVGPFGFGENDVNLEVIGHHRSCCILDTRPSL